MVKDGLDSIGCDMDVKDLAEILWERIAKDEDLASSSTVEANKIS
jgi:hypothetical protein